MSFYIGNFDGEAKQFAVKRNSPDQSTISISSEIIKYKLLNFYYTSNGQPWDHMTLKENIGVVSNEQENIKGTVLVQLIESRKIKFEVFPNKITSQVNGFTPNAKIYVR